MSDVVWIEMTLTHDRVKVTRRSPDSEQECEDITDIMVPGGRDTEAAFEVWAKECGYPDRGIFRVCHKVADDGAVTTYVNGVCHGTPTDCTEVMLIRSAAMLTTEEIEALRSR